MKRVRLIAEKRPNVVVLSYKTTWASVAHSVRFSIVQNVNFCAKIGYICVKIKNVPTPTVFYDE